MYFAEHHNAILTDMVIKVKEDTKRSTNDALAVSAKNTLANIHRHSPNQLVFEKKKKKKFPSALNKLTALKI